MSDEATEVLRLICQEIKNLGTNLGGRIGETNSRLDQTNSRLEQTNSRLDQTNSRLEAVRVELKEEIRELRTGIDSARVESEMRVATLITDVASKVTELVEMQRSLRIDNTRLSRCEERIEVLESRMSSGSDR